MTAIQSLDTVRKIGIFKRMRRDENLSDKELRRAFIRIVYNDVSNDQSLTYEHYFNEAVEHVEKMKRFNFIDLGIY